MLPAPAPPAARARSDTRPTLAKFVAMSEEEKAAVEKTAAERAAAVEGGADADLRIDHVADEMRTCTFTEETIALGTDPQPRERELDRLVGRR